MKVFLLQDTLNANGCVFREYRTIFGRKKTYTRPTQVLIFDDALSTMYVTMNDSDAYKEFILAQEQETSAEATLSPIKPVALDKIKKVIYRPKFEPRVMFGVADGAYHDTEIRFSYELPLGSPEINSISSLWLMNRDICDILAPYLTKTGMRSDLEYIADFIVPRYRLNPFLMVLQRNEITDGVFTQYWSAFNSRYDYWFDRNPDGSSAGDRPLYKNLDNDKDNEE